MQTECHAFFAPRKPLRVTQITKRQAPQTHYMLNVPYFSTWRFKRFY